MSIEIEHLIGKGATAKVYRNGHTAIKIYTDTSEDEVSREMKCQYFAYKAGLPVPKVYSINKIKDEFIALEMEYIDGSPLIHHNMDEVEIGEAISVLVKLQREIHTIQAPELFKLSDIITQKILSTNLEIKIKNELLMLLSELDDQSEKLCHGDFHPFNVLYDGHKHWIIDWVDATAGNPLADFCRTYLLIKSQMEEVAELYLQITCNEVGCLSSDVLKWQPVIAAARLNENIDGLSKSYLYELVQLWYERLK